MTPTIFLFARLIAVFFVLWAIGKHSHNYYVFLRWFIFLTAAWGAYRAYQDLHREWLFILMHLALAVLFNPILPFTFQKSTWTILNLISAWVLLISVSVLDPEPLVKFIGTTIGNAVRAVLAVGWGVGLILVGALLIYSAMDRILNGWWLWKNAQQTQAQIMTVVHRVEFVESETRAGYVHSYDVKYSFDLEGQHFSGIASLSDNPVTEDIDEEDEITPATPTYLDVQYQSNNPHNNRAIGEGSILAEALPAFLVLALGLWPTVAGVNILRKRLFKI